jgi:hypothetical protein
MELERVNKYYNAPQAMVMLTKANTTIAIMGRGLGKTVGIMAPKLHELVHSMPRCTINIYNSTYRHFMLQTGKELFYGLQSIGYIEGVHYVYRKSPPSSWPRPYRNPGSPEYSIFFYNGTVVQVLSEDVFNNGGSAQATMGDEARKFDAHKFAEVYLAMRDETNFEGNPDYRSLTLTSDQPQSPAEMWLLDYEKKMDVEQIERIQDAQSKINEFLLERFSEKSEAKKKYLTKKIAEFSRPLALMRKGSVLFIEASTLENIYALGTQYLDDLKKFLPEAHFRIAVLNNRLRMMDRAFFPSFDRAKHCYTAFDYNYLESKGIILPENTLFSSQDSEINPALGFVVAIDSGGSFNCVVVGQKGGAKFKIVNCFHTTPPYNIKDVAYKFCEYYANHKEKKVHFIWDPTQNASNFSGFKAYKMFIEALREKKWSVYEDYRTAIPSYENRFIFFDNLFQGNYVGTIPQIEIHKVHCENLIIGLETTQTLPGHKDKYHIDKRPEKREDVDQSKITHYPEAFMVLLYHLFSASVNSSGSFVHLGFSGQST